MQSINCQVEHTVRPAFVASSSKQFSMSMSWRWMVL